MNKKLKSVSMFSFVIQGLVGITLLTLPRDVGEFAKNDSWLSIILVGIHVMLNASAFYWLALKYPGLNFSQLNEKLLGKILGKTFMLGMSIYLAITFGLSLRLFGDSISIFLLENTPKLLIMLIMLGGCVYCITRDIRSISIIFDILLPFVLIIIVILILLSMTAAEPKNLLPVMHHGIVPVAKGAIHVLDPLASLGIIAYIMPYFEDPKSTKKWIFFGLGVALSIYFSLVVLCIMVFGAEEIKYLIYPVLSLSKSMQLTNQLFERAESLFMAAWVPITFSTLVVHYIASNLNLKALFNTNKNRLIIYGQIPLFLIIALFPRNSKELSDYLHFNSHFTIFLNLLYFPLFLIIAIVKGRRGKK